jgi:hypothetical protein
MTTARAGHTATLLRDGRVLIAGGFDIAGKGLASAELYDPASGTFTPTGDMTEPRGAHMATLLGNGKVLIAGGQTDLTVWALLDSAEIYDPSTGAFTATSKMISGGGAGFGPSTLLPDGRVFLPTVSNAETYDTQSGSFAATGAYSTSSYLFYSITLLQDGRVLVVGVADSAGSAGTTQLFDPKTNTFSPTGPIGCSDCTVTATLLPDGEVLVNMSGEAELYNPVSGTFINLGNTGPNNQEQTGSTATLLSNGRVLIAGGALYVGHVNPVGSPAVELYSPATRTFAPGQSLRTARYDHTATVLADNSSVLIAGGYSAWHQATASAEIYK